VGQTGIVGNVTSTGTPRIALDTGADAIYFNNPNLPDTRSEMALPLRARGSIIGALDVQSTIQNAFTDTDISLLTLLADQIAIAIDNARLIDEAQSALAESQTIFSEYVAEAWQRKTASGVIGYHQTLTGGKVLTDLTPDSYKEHANGHKSLEIPIRVRDQVIGMLNVRSVSKETEWSEDDLNVAQAITERLGLALDNARLFEETSTRASRERLVTEITTKIRGTNNPQEMIKTAVEELKQALGTTRVEIFPKISPPTDK
jgi:GAF domain-containing protein